MKMCLKGCAVLSVALASWLGGGSAAWAQLTFAIQPASVSNTYSGAITLQIAGVSPGATVVVQKFLDLNANGVVDTNDLPVEQFDLTDGQPGMVIGGVTNFNVPGDFDGAVNGQITATLAPNSEIAQHIVGTYLFKLSSASGAVTNSFTVTNFPFAQSLQGTVRSNNTAVSVPYAVVVLLPPPRGGNHGPGNPVAATVANAIGGYSVSVPPGTYIPVAFKDGYAAQLSTSPVVTTNTTGPVYLILTNATESISGRLVDINTGSGIPGIFNGNNSANGFISLSFTDTNGDFTEHVVPDVWQFDGEPEGLAVHGYVGYNGKTNVDATGGSVSGLTLGFHKGNALFYGTVSDGNGQPLPGIDIYASDNFGEFQADGYTDDSGRYFVVALGGLSGDTWQAQVSSDNAPANYIFSQPAFDQNGGTNLNAGQAAHVNFTGLLATNRITGRVQFNGTNVVGVGVSAYANIGGEDYNAYVDTDTNGNYSLNVANSNVWSVSVNCGGGNDSLDNILGVGNYQCPNNQNVTINNHNGTADFTIQPAGSSQQIISGYVTDASGQPVVGATVHANDGIGDNYSTPTDTNGFYSFNVGNGDWDMSVDCGYLNSLGYRCVSDQVVNVSGSNATVNFLAEPLEAQTIILTSDADTLAASQSDETALDAGDTSGLTFQPVIVGAYGTYTPVPPQAPSGTEIVQIPPADGENGFFKMTFVLPQIFRGIQLSGAANADDSGRAFLNGHPLTPSLTSGDPGIISENGDVTFSATNVNWFNSGTNVFLVSDWNGGGGPSGAAFYAVVSFITVPSFGSATMLSNGQFQFMLNGASNQNYTVQMSTNLSSTNWVTLYVTNNPATNLFRLSDLNATNQQRFYRVLVGQGP